MDELIRLVEQAEGDLSSLNAEELSQLRAALQSGYTEVRPSVETDEQVEALAAVVAAISRVDAELSAREVASAEREQRLAEFDAAVSDDDADDDAEGDDAEGESSDDEDEDEPDAEASSESSEPESQQVAASAVGRRPDLSVLRRSQRRPVEQDEQREVVASMALRGRVVAAAQLPELGTGESFATVDQLGQSISRLAMDLRVPKPSDRKFYLGRAQLADRRMAVRQDEHVGDDRSLLDLAVEKAKAAKLGDARKVASGGVCVPAQPDYTITTVGERGTPWVDGLPTVTGNRPISYFQWLNMSLNDAAGSRPGARPDGGIGVVTAAQDAAGYGSGPGQHLPKDCVRIDCPSPVTEAPEAVFRCTTVGNFQAITWPEYVRTFDETVGFYFDVYRDELALAKVVAGAKNLAMAGPTFGAARDLLDAMRRLVAHVRSTRKAPSLAFTFAVPAFARYMIAQDLASSWSASSVDSLRISASQALALLAVDEGILLAEYDVSIGSTATGQPTVLPEHADGDPLGDWPTEIRIIAYPEGGIVRHDYGELSFGLRETGISTNDFSGFYETFEQLLIRTSDVYTIDVPLCVNGAAGAAVEKACGVVSR